MAPDTHAAPRENDLFFSEFAFLAQHHKLVTSRSPSRRSWFFRSETARALSMTNTVDDAERNREARREFLAKCGKLAAITPPAVTLLLATSEQNYASATSSSHGGGGSRHRDDDDDDDRNQHRRRRRRRDDD
jgi:hypothetical protein